MIRFPRLGAALLLLACALSGMAQDRGTWSAASSNARAITGDLEISDARLSINFAKYPLAQIRSITPAEAAALFQADSSAPGSGNLYRLSVPPTKQFLHHNTLCGSEETQWMVTWLQGKDLQVAFFSGSKMPILTFDALNSSADLCGTFSYLRW